MIANAALHVFFHCFNFSDVASIYLTGSWQHVSEAGRGHHAPHLEAGTYLEVDARDKM